MKYFETIENRIIKNAKIYIVPSKEGMLYIAINFTLFLIGLTYANNFTLLISFILFIFFLMTMFHTHQIMEKLETPKVMTIKGDSQTFRLVIHDLDENISINYRSVDKTKYNFKKSFQENTFHCPDLKRGKYQNGDYLYYTFGLYHLFYVWTYRKQEDVFFIYPTPIANTLDSHSYEAQINPIGNDEFSHHTLYQQGLNSKRIDWKVYARTNSLYSKNFTYENPLGLSLDYYRLNDEHEVRLSKLAYLVEKTKTENQKFELKLPNFYLPLDKGETHRQNALEFLSIS